jgi:hypothetical protein
MNWTIDEEWRTADQDRNPSKSEAEALRSAWADSKREIARATDLAAFLLSTDVESKLRELEQGLSTSNRAEDYREHLAMQQDAVKQCLASVTSLAKRDLRAE